MAGLMENKTKKIAIVWANPYNKNLGVGALAYSALSIFHDIIKENNIDADITFIGSEIDKKDSISINNEEISFNNIRGLNYYNFKSWINLIIFPTKFKIYKVIAFDYVYDIAEGDSFTDIYGSKRFWQILNSKKLFSLFNIKQILLPQTIGPFKDKNHEKAAFKAMHKIDMVISRDSQSYDYTARYLPKEKILESIDVAFYMPYKKNEFNNGKINVGINVSGLLWNGGYTKNNQFEMKTDYKVLVKNIITYFSKEPTVKLHLVPHVIPLKHAVEDDYKVSEELQNEFENITIAPRFIDPIEAKNYISGFDFFIGARMHSCIAAFSAGVPVYPMAYSRKFNGLFVDTLKYKYLGDCVNQSEDIILQNLKDAYENRALLKVEINEANEMIVKPRLKALKKILFESLKS